MYYHKLKEALCEPPEPTMMPDYFMPPKFTTEELASLAGCSLGSVRKYISRMREEGYDVKVADGEYYIPVEDSYRKDFAVRTKHDIHGGEDYHRVETTHNGYQWSGLAVHNLRELRALHEALGEYIEERISEERQNRSA